MADITRHPEGVQDGKLQTDPGTGTALPVDQSYYTILVTGAGAETNTMAIPAIRGQRQRIILGTAGGGTRTVTVASAINAAGNTKMAFTQAADAITLEAWQTATAGTLAWRVVYNDGVTLS